MRISDWSSDVCSSDLEVVQEAYARLWTADAEAIRNARAYLYVTARHIVGEQVRRSRIFAIDLVADLDALHIVVEETNVHRSMSGQEELAIGRAACRERGWQYS